MKGRFSLSEAEDSQLDFGSETAAGVFIFCKTVSKLRLHQSISYSVVYFQLLMKTIQFFTTDNYCATKFQLNFRK